MYYIALGLTLLPLLLGINNFCMEREENDQPSKIHLEQQLEQFRREQAAKYRRKQEEAKKEAERKRVKSKAEAKKIVESLLGAARGKEEEEKPLTFEEAKKNIEKERERLKEQERQKAKQEAEPIERETQRIKPPKSLFQFLKDNAARLGNKNVDENLLEQLIVWLKNREINVNEEELFEYLGHADVNSRIIYAVFRDPTIKFSQTRVYIGDEHYASMGLNTRREFMLFSSFSLPPWVMLWKDLPDSELKRWITTNYYLYNTTEYLSTTKNLDVIKIIWLLAVFGPNFTDNAARLAINMNVTGNETASDGTTALMFAVGGGYLELVRELLRRGANPFHANCYSDDALSIIDIQLRRIQLHDQAAYYAIYEQIKALLDDAAKKRAQDAARAIYTLMLARVVENPDGTRNIVPGLPYEIALRIVTTPLNSHKEQRILHYLEQLTPDEQATLRQEVQAGGVVATPTLERLRSYLPAGIVAALSYYLAPRK